MVDESLISELLGFARTDNDFIKNHGAPAMRIVLQQIKDGSYTEEGGRSIWGATTDPLCERYYEEFYKHQVLPWDQFFTQELRTEFAKRIEARAFMLAKTGGFDGVYINEPGAPLEEFHAWASELLEEVNA